MPKRIAELLAKLFLRKNPNLSMGYVIFGIAQHTTIIIIVFYTRVLFLYIVHTKKKKSDYLLIGNADFNYKVITILLIYKFFP